jgi:hypothetical protein
VRGGVRRRGGRCGRVEALAGGSRRQADLLAALLRAVRTLRRRAALATYNLNYCGTAARCDGAHPSEVSLEQWM